MKIFVASDIHGSAFYCEKLLDAFDREQADRLLLLGDILYHGPRNDLPRDYDPKRVAPMLNARRDRILCVRGNCDSEVHQMVLDFPILSDSCMLFLGGHVLVATHGHVWNPENLPPLCPGDILLNEAFHTAIYLGNGILVHASGNEFDDAIGGMPGDQTGEEIYIRTYYWRPWNGILRLV